MAKIDSLPGISRPKVDFNFYDLDQGVKEAPIKEVIYEPFGPILETFTDRSTAIFLSGAAGTGKTRGILEKLLIVAENYPGAQIAITRKKRVDLSNSALATFEKIVLPKNHPASNGATRAHREVYRFRNGSEIHVFGLQDTSGKNTGQTGPQKLTSTEWDIIFMNEVNECDYVDFVTAKSRLRGTATPYRQVLADFNPVISTHWIYQAASRGELQIHHTVHHDNPRWFYRDENGTVEHPITKELGFWTTDGEDYINGILSKLEGNMRKRFFLGEPITPEEVIYKEFNPEIHCQKESLIESLSLDIQEGRKTREEVEKWLYETFDFIQSNDWGYEHPLAYLFFTIDKNNHMRRIAEMFRCETLTNVAAKEWLEYCGWSYDKENDVATPLDEPILGFSIPIYWKGNQNVTVVTDHDPESRGLFTEETGLMTELAVKSVETGIEGCRKRLSEATISFDPIIPIGGFDYKLKAKMHPMISTEEFIEYKNKSSSKMGVTNNPIKRFDDGMDSIKYAVAYVDKIPEDNKYDAKKVVQTTSLDPDVIFASFAVVSGNRERSLFFGKA